MSPPAIPVNDASPMTTREALQASLMQIEPRTGAMSVAWDEMAACALRRDDAGFAAAQRIFRALDTQA